jgi:hypothetical protein
MGGALDEGQEGEVLSSCWSSFLYLYCLFDKMGNKFVRMGIEEIIRLLHRIEQG